MAKKKSKGIKIPGIKKRVPVPAVAAVGGGLVGVFFLLRGGGGDRARVRSGVPEPPEPPSPPAPRDDNLRQEVGTALAAQREAFASGFSQLSERIQELGRQRSGRPRRETVVIPSGSQGTQTVLVDEPAGQTQIDQEPDQEVSPEFLRSFRSQLAESPEGGEAPVEGEQRRIRPEEAFRLIPAGEEFAVAPGEPALGVPDPFGPGGFEFREVTEETAANQRQWFQSGDETESRSTSDEITRSQQDQEPDRPPGRFSIGQDTPDPVPEPEPEPEPETEIDQSLQFKLSV